MEINGKVHCFFEQSGTFKNEFIKLGIPAEDYDIQNEFGQTDHVVDLFGEIERAYDGNPSIFDSIGGGDLIMAFFPCIHFCNFAELNQQCPESLAKSRGWDKRTKWSHQLKASQERQKFYELALKMTAVVEIRGLRMIVENPWGELNYTNHWWFNKPKFIDMDRRTRGDYFRKPTAFWFLNCDPCRCETFQAPKKKMRISKYDHKKSDTDSARMSSRNGICSEERSMISPDYARNFIADLILGRPCGTKPQQQELF